MNIGNYKKNDNTVEDGMTFITHGIFTSDKTELRRSLDEFGRGLYRLTGPAFDQYAGRLNQVNAFSTLLYCVRFHYDDEEIIDAAVKVLAYGPQWVDFDPSLGAVQATLHVAKKYPNNESIQVHSMCFLGDLLSSGTDDQSMAEARNFAEMGGVAWVINAMKFNKTSESIQEAGCVVICSLVDTMPMYCHAVIKMDGMAVVSEVMAMHGDDKRVADRVRKTKKLLKASKYHCASAMLSSQS